MKKLLLLLTFSAFTSLIQAQTMQPRVNDHADSVILQPLMLLPEALDFTVTFTDGTTANLFNTLDEGNSVMLDFFYTS